MRFIWQIGVFGALLLGLPVPASAASFSRSYYGDCRVDITGPIVQGDYEALLELRDYLVIEDGESTSSSVVCLDSPGGSVLAGMKIAEFILEEGVSTRIPEGAECYSICAIIFMMGNYRGSEVSGISRRMHVSSQLGFHRPYLSLEEAGSYTSGDIEVSYELGIATVFEILTLANRRAPWGNERIIEPDLMARIMGTPGDQIYPILLVEEVLRWKISVDGIQLPSITQRSALQFSCENALSIGHMLTSELSSSTILTSSVYSFDPLPDYMIREVSEGAQYQYSDETYSIRSLRGGYAGVGCRVKPIEEYDVIAVCGYDGETDMSVGDCSDENGMRHFSPMIAYHPSTSLLALSLVDSSETVAATFRHCLITATDGSIADDEACLQEVSFHSDQASSFVRHIFTWPSGARTVVEIEGDAYDEVGDVRINGITATHLEDRGDADCLLNPASGNIFCLMDSR